MSHVKSFARSGAAAALAVTILAGVALAHHTAGDFDAARAREILRRHPLRTLDGRTLTLGKPEGEVVVVNFWASWCAPCRRELPDLNRFHAQIAQRGGRVVAVSIDQDLANVKRFVKKHALTMPVCHDGPSGLARSLDLEHVPFTIVLDRSGNVAWSGSGSDAATLARLAAETNRLLAARPAIDGSAEASR
jgi:thiol-disulfide isomerase/thioredoxin